jgi:tRNA A-37 threonylcarbamoyl transferase component Bud32
MPGRRQVFDAMWNDTRVIVKLFLSKISAKRHLRREWQGLNELTKRHLRSPAPLFYGKTELGQWALIVEKIVESSTALEIFNQARDTADKLDFLTHVCVELAKHHDKGVLQKDLHLGNFLWQKGRLFAVDPAQIWFRARPVGRKKSISQLALLATHLPGTDTQSIAALRKQYFDARDWRLEESDKAFFGKKLAALRKKGVRKALKKCLRTSRHYARIQADGYAGVFDREFCQGAEAVDLIRHIDPLMDKGRILKNGNTCYVSRLTWNAKDIVVKRYNHKGFIHSLRHTLKKSRAERNWLHSHRLQMLQVPTPRALAYIEQRKGPFLWKSYLVTTYVEGQRLSDFLTGGEPSGAQRSTVIQEFKQLLEKLGEHRISHGDLKSSNILITENGIVLTDLDGMKVCKCKRLYRSFRARDLARFAETTHLS